MNELFSVDSQYPQQVANSHVAWIDVDRDLSFDFLLIDVNSTLGTHSQIFQFFHQNATNQFFDITNSATFPVGVPPGMYSSCISVVDYDADGRMDFTLMGLNEAVSLSNMYLYHQNSTGVFYNFDQLP